MSILFAAVLNVLPVQEPRNNAQCYNTVRRLGTDNVPMDNTLAHSVVNVWAFLSPGEAHPVAFLYKNYSSEYYLEFTKFISIRDAASWRIPSRFLVRKVEGVNFRPQRVNTSEILGVQQLLLSHNVVMTGCFTHDLQMSR